MLWENGYITLCIIGDNISSTQFGMLSNTVHVNLVCTLELFDCVALHVQGYMMPLHGYLLSQGEGPNFIHAVFSNINKLRQLHE